MTAGKTSWQVSVLEGQPRLVFMTDKFYDLVGDTAEAEVAKMTQFERLLATACLERALLVLQAAP